MEAKIELVQTRSAQYLKHEEFHSGVVEAINQLLEELAKPEKDPSSLTSRLKEFFEPLRFSDKFDSNSVSQVCKSVSRLLVPLTSEHLNQIQSGVRSDEFRLFVENLCQGLERAFNNVLASLPEGENHSLKTFLRQTNASSVLGKIYGATILVLFAAWAKGVVHFQVPGQESYETYQTKGCCVPLVRILLEEILRIPHDSLGPATREQIEGAAIALGAKRPEALEQL
jgi:hypothetical protein